MKPEIAQSFFTQSSDCINNSEELLIEVLAVPLTRNMGQAAEFYDITVVGKVLSVGDTAQVAQSIREGDVVYLEHSILCLKCRHCMTGSYSACLTQRGYSMISGQLGRYLRVVPGSRLHKLPGDMPIEQVALCFYAERALYVVVEKGLGRLGTSFLLVGCDLAGLFCAIAAKSAGLTPVRVLVGEGESTAWLKTFLPEFEVVDSLSGDARFDIIVANTVSSPLLEQIAEHFNPLGRCVCLMDNVPEFFFFEQMLRNELSFTGALHPSAMFDKGLLLLRKNSLIVEKIATLSYSAAKFSEAIAEARNSGWSKNILLVPGETSKKE